MAVLNWNEPAIKFYRAFGAKPMNEWTVFRLSRDGIARLAKSEHVVGEPAPSPNYGGQERVGMRGRGRISGEETYQD